jgi:hypothetical protein
MLLPPIIGDIGEQAAFFFGLLVFHHLSHYLGFGMTVEILVLSVFQPDSFTP